MAMTTEGSVGDNAHGIEQLVTSCESSFSDVAIEKSQKLLLFSQHVKAWLRKEPTKILQGDQPLSVNGHATFGQMKAVILMTCTCSQSQGDRSGCALHCHDPSIADLVFTVAQSVHPVFNDGFLCFANLLMDQVSKGGMGW